MTDRAYGMENWQAVKDEMTDLLIDVAARRETIGYAELGRSLETATLHHRNPALYAMLRDICEDEREAGRPNLCALVVRVSDGIPGPGFFKHNALHGDEILDPIDYWRACVDDCWAYWAREQTS